jgi:hypothetical protein
MTKESLKDTKKQEAEETHSLFQNRKYDNPEIIERVEGIANEILKETTSNKYRDHFFHLMIEKLGLKNGVEIGVDLGLFAQHILTKTKIEKYYCVDLWMDNFGSDYKPGYYDKDGNNRFNKAKEALGPFLGNIEIPLEDSGRAAMLKMSSEKASKLIQDDTLDFCYIDGDHSLEGVFKDIYCWMPKIKIGGIVGFHDFKDGPKSGITNFWGEQLDYKVKTVAEYYCLRYGHKLNVIGGRILNGWFVKNR